ncbi:hypothetical protein FKM82_017564 [Ascaphus truei]
MFLEAALYLVMNKTLSLIFVSLSLSFLFSNVQTLSVAKALSYALLICLSWWPLFNNLILSAADWLIKSSSLLQFRLNLKNTAMLEIHSG